MRLISETSGATGVRVLTALVLVPLTFVLIWTPQLNLGFLVFIAALGGIGVREFYRMAEAKSLEPKLLVGTLFAVAIILSGYFGLPHIPGLLLFIAFAVLTCFHLSKVEHSLPSLAASLMGLVYVGWLPAHFVLLHQVPQLGPGLVTLLIIAVALSDTGAYFVGRAMGRHKLAPAVSPNKTVEGAIGGVLCAVLGMAAVFFLCEHYDWIAYPVWPLWRYLATGAALAVASQLGDLAESMLKRDAGIKDSGAIFPGHGGVLDRCDGFLFTGPMLYYLMAL